MKKYIDADIVNLKLKQICDNRNTSYGIQFGGRAKDFAQLTDNIPAADVKEIVHGEWIEKEHWVPLSRDYEVSYDSYCDDYYDEKTHSWKEKYWHCSCCSYEASRFMKPVYKYCPNCGAKMREWGE